MKEKVILAAVFSSSQEACEESLDELEALAKTAGAQVEGRLIQHRDRADSVSYLGSGKILELAELAAETEADTVIFDDELSPAVLRFLVKELDCKVIDRTLLILDIFAARANSAEGKIQVELAQLQYRMTHLSGQGLALSRQGGGIGTRGPGEKKLETDRRLIRKRISRLKEDLAQVQRHRDVLRSGRRKKGMPLFAIVGYTNAGKSTLFNRLTGSSVLEEDALFATLDPATGKMALPDGQEVLVTDTVGFIRKLPHHLVDAFKSTLEEACYADVIIHVADASSPHMEEQMHTVYETMSMLGAGSKPVITVMNKMDKVESDMAPKDRRADVTVALSALTGAGIEQLSREMGEILVQDQILIERSYSYGETRKVALLHQYGRILEETYLEESIYIKAYVPPQIYGSV